MQYSIRPAGPQDVSSMYRISISDHAESYYDRLIPHAFQRKFHRKYTASNRGRIKFIDDMIQRLNDPTWRIFVAEAKDEILGYTLAHFEEDVLGLKGLFVAPAYHKMGIGSRLFETSLEIAPQGMTIRFLVISNNDIAKRLYIRHGFRVVGQSPGLFYGAKQDIMER